MAQLLSKKNCLCALILFACFSSFAQPEEPHNSADYKEPKQFEKFYKRRNVIGAWQVNELKTGALVVRLKTNKKLIDALKADGNPQMAEEKQLEQYIINKNTMLAYIDHYKFSKVYFIYSNSSDSLLNGIRKGIFVDTNMVVNQGIIMSEKFYLLAERDYVYNSSIGFVREDSARSTIEKGNPVKEMAVVIKNKYGHQLKSPFPYFVKEKSSVGSSYTLPVTVTTAPDGLRNVRYVVNKTYLQDLKDASKKTKAIEKTPDTQLIKIRKELTYEKISMAVSQFTDFLRQYYQSSPKPEMDRIDEQTKLFLY